MNIKKFLVGAAAGALMLGAIVIPALAKGPNGPAGNSNKAHLYLYQKDPVSWDIVAGGAWGKMTYDRSGPAFNYVFNGQGLEADKEYSLIYYADPWPGDNPGALIASGLSDEGGNIHLAGSTNLGINLPDPEDANYNEEGCGDPGTPGDPPPFPCGGAKIWLVLSDDYDSEARAMTGWNPTEYLFENNLINFTSP